jgi:hypothetical protein
MLRESSKNLDQNGIVAKKAAKTRDQQLKKEMKASKMS